MSNHAVEILAKKLKTENGLKHTEALREAHYTIQTRNGHVELGFWKNEDKNKLRWCEEVLFNLDPVVVDGHVAQWSLASVNGASSFYGSVYFSLDIHTRVNDIPETLATVGVEQDPHTEEGIEDFDEETLEDVKAVYASIVDREGIHDAESYLEGLPENTLKVNIDIADAVVCEANHLEGKYFDSGDVTVYPFWLDEVKPENRAKAIAEGINQSIKLNLKLA